MLYSGLLLLIASCFLKPSLADEISADNIKANFPFISLQDDKLFDSVINGPRSKGYVVLFNARGNYGCVACEKVYHEFETVAQNYFAAKKSAVLFSVVEFKNGQVHFGKMGFNSAPLMVYFAPGTGKKFISYDFRHGSDASAIAEQLRRTAGIEITLKKPFNYTLLAVLFITFVVAASLFKVFFAPIKSLVQSPTVWGASTIIFVILMITGFMWNQIRKPPYVGSNGNRLNIISGGFQMQFGLESQVVGFLNAACSFSLIMLASKANTMKTLGNQRLLVVSLVAIFLVSYSFILSIFRQKSGGYPLRLLF